MQLQERMKVVAQVNEGETPAEDPLELLREWEAAHVRLEDLLKRVNRTNSQTQMPSGETLTDVLARRDILRKRHLFLTQLATEATPNKKEYYSSIASSARPSISVPTLRKSADELGKQIREIEVLVQETNWRTELAD